MRQMVLTARLALRNLARNQRRTLLTAMIISLSLAALVFTDGLVQAMSDTMVRAATRLYAGDAQIHHRDYRASRDEADTIAEPERLLARLAQAEGVAAQTPRALAMGMISSAANNRAVQVVGVDPEREAGVSRLADAIVSGDYLAADGAETQLLIGRRLAELLEAEIGERIVVSVSNQQSGTAEQQLFRVSGIFHFATRGLDENTAFVLLPRAQSMLGIGAAVHQVAFNLSDASRASDPDLPLFAELSDEAVIAEGWTDLMPQLASMLQMTGYSTLIVGVILFILAALGVINGIFMSIYERTWEFGVLLAIGTRRTTLFGLILAESLLLGLGAVLLGLGVGWLVTLWSASVGIDYGSMEIAGVSLAEVIRPELRAWQFTVLPVWVLVLTLVASLYPAAHAARLNPARALHKSL